MKHICEQCGRNDLPLMEVKFTMTTKDGQSQDGKLVLCVHCLKDQDERILH